MCGKNAVCFVSGDAVECYCPDGMSGDPFVACEPIRSEVVKPQRKEPSLKIKVSISKKGHGKFETKFGKKPEKTNDGTEDFRTDFESNVKSFLNHLLDWTQNA